MDDAILYNCQTDHAPPDWTQFAAIEVGGCIDDDGQTIGGIPDAEAQFWTVYGRDHHGMAEAITDCTTREMVDRVAAHLSGLSGLPIR